MVKEITPYVKIVPPPKEHVKADKHADIFGNHIGSKKYGERWYHMKYPSETKLRFAGPPRLEDDGKLTIEVYPYEWSSLVARRQIQQGYRLDLDPQDPANYLTCAVTLAANALIETSDGKFAFHYKRGGAKHGSIHTFGGYVQEQDLEGGEILSFYRRSFEDKGELGLEGMVFAASRELMEKGEVGAELKKAGARVKGFFGTPEGMPSVLWHYGTAGIYAWVRIGMTAKQLQKHFEGEDRAESLRKELYIVERGKIRNLKRDKETHEQTRKVISTIAAICKEEERAERKAKRA